MKMTDIIAKTQKKIELSSEEFDFLINGFTDSSIPDYQISAWLMAVYFQGLTDKELVVLTQKMADSGENIKFPDISGSLVDKHSTGGVGDKVSLVLAPLIAVLGLKISKLSGRALSFAGGTLDKLDSIPGFTSELTVEQIQKQVNDIGVVIAGQTAEIAPADKKLYYLRDVTGTVNSLPLMASSIMSKKLAVDSDTILLDVKTGEGAFCQTEDEAIELAKIMVSIGVKSGRKTEAVVSQMNEILGHAVGNSLEVIETINTLKGKGPEDLMELINFILTRLLIVTDHASSEEKARTLINEAIHSGAAFEKFKELVAYQEGDISVIDNPELLPIGKLKTTILANENGYIQSMRASNIGFASMKIGAGRERKDDTIDYGVGIIVEKKVGEKVNIGDVLATVYSNTELPKSIESTIQEAFKIGERTSLNQPVIVAHIYSDEKDIIITKLSKEEIAH